MLADLDQDRGQFSAINTHTAVCDDSSVLLYTHEICVFKRRFISQRIYELWKERFGFYFRGQFTISDEPPTGNLAIVVVDQHLSFESVLALQSWLHGYDPEVIVSERWPIECLKAKAVQQTENFKVHYNFP
jgi:hypothetical protein